MSTSNNDNPGYFWATFLSGINGWKASSSALFSIHTQHWSPNSIRIANLDPTSSKMFYGSIRVTFVFINNAITLPYVIYFQSNLVFPLSLSSGSSNWEDNANTICGLNFIHFTVNFIDYTISIAGSMLSLQNSVPQPCCTYWPVNGACLVAGSQVCPSGYPFYDSSTNLCHSSCTGSNVSTYLCTPAFTCPSNCKYCSSNTTCKICYRGYYLRSDNLCYSSCLGSILFGTNICCPTGCSICTSSTTCQICFSPL